MKYPLLILLLFSASLLAQPQIEWIKRTPLTTTEFIYDLRSLDSQTYQMITIRDTRPADSIWILNVIKLNLKLDTLSQRSYRLPDYLFDLLPFADGRTAVLLQTSNLLMLSAQGDSLWTSPAPDATLHAHTRLTQTTDGSFILGGAAYNGKEFSLRLMKLSAEGQRVWVRNYMTTAEERGLFDLAAAPNGGVYVLHAFGVEPNITGIMHVSADGDSLANLIPRAS